MITDRTNCSDSLPDVSADETKGDYSARLTYQEVLLSRINSWFVRYSLVVAERDYVPHPLPTLVVGVLVLGVGFAINLYLTGSTLGHSECGLFLILLGTITVFSSAGSVDTKTQWTYGVGLLSTLAGSSVIATLYPELGANIRIKQLHAGLQVAVIIIGLLAVANTTARYWSPENHLDDRVSTTLCSEDTNVTLGVRKFQRRRLNPPRV